MASRGGSSTRRRNRPGFAQPRTASALEVLYEDDYVIAVNKPSGLLSIATEKERIRTVHAELNEQVQRRSRGRERVFIVHRLDREVSGVMLFAKSLEAQETLQRGWSTAEKRYYALVEGHPRAKSGTVKSWLRENRALRVYSGREGPDAKLAITHYRTVKLLARRSLLEVRLETGRKHQIRVHLADLGCPIVGDRRYGAPAPARSRRAGRHGHTTSPFGLCAYSLAFDHPADGKRVTVEVPMPREMRELV